MFKRKSCVQVAVLSLFYARSKVPKRVTVFVEKCINLVSSSELFFVKIDGPSYPHESSCQSVFSLRFDG